MGSLDYITMSGFKSLASIEKLPLRGINVIIGPNGSGKSNFVGMFSFLQAIRDGRLREYVARSGGAEKLLYFGSKTTSSIRFHLSFNHEAAQYAISLSPTPADELFPTSEEVFYWDRANSAENLRVEALRPWGGGAGISDPRVLTSSGTGLDDPRIREAASFVRAELESWRLYHLHDTSASSPMRKTADLNDNRYLRPDGSNLAAFLYYLQQKHETSYDMIRRTIQRVAPFFEDFILAPSKLNPEKIRLEWRHKNSDQYFDVSSLSDGTLRFIGLATLFLQPHNYRPSVIVVDEPELGLHPYAITMLGSLVNGASERTQVILSTQSSLLLDQFQPEDVLVADRVGDATVFSRLASEPLEFWLEEYSLGQLWEKNEFGGRP